MNGLTFRGHFFGQDKQYVFYIPEHELTLIAVHPNGVIEIETVSKRYMVSKGHEKYVLGQIKKKVPGAVFQRGGDDMDYSI